MSLLQFKRSESCVANLGAPPQKKFLFVTRKTRLAVKLQNPPQMSIDVTSDFFLTRPEVSLGVRKARIARAATSMKHDTHHSYNEFDR